MDLALNNLQWLMSHKTKPNQNQNQNRNQLSGKIQVFKQFFIFL